MKKLRLLPLMRKEIGAQGFLAQHRVLSTVVPWYPQGIPGLPQIPKSLDALLLYIKMLQSPVLAKKKKKVSLKM
jgi:hypothetical protein